MADKGMNHKREIVGIFYLAAALILAAAYYLGDIIDPFGKIFRYAGFGLFGIAAYAIPAILFYMALDYFLERESIITRKRFLYVTILLISISAIIHVFAVPMDKFKDAITARGEDPGAFQALIHLWRIGTTGFESGAETSNLTGGLLGGGLAFALEGVANKVGAIIILITIFISEIVLLFNVSFSHAIRTTKDKMDTALRNKAEIINENARKKASEFNMVVGDEKTQKATEKKENAKKPGLFGIPGFLNDTDKENESTVTKAFDGNNTFHQVTSSFNEGEYDSGENSNDSMSNPNIDLPAGVKRVDMGNGSTAGKDDYSIRKIIVPHQDPRENAHEHSSDDSEAVTYPERPYVLPSIELLNTESFTAAKNDLFTIQAVGKKLETTLASFGIAAKVMNITNGPVITRFELAPGPGVKISKIVSLADDIALNLAATGVRIEAPIPGKSAIGIEVPNKEITPVTLRRLIESPEFKNTSSVLACVLGRDIPGNPVICDLAKMPHLLIAGATGSGKSVCINSILISILFKATPDEVKFLMIDPKVVELSAYNGIPHLLAPVVTNPKKAANTLNWAVNEMTKRYALFAEQQVREIQSYNASSTSGGYDKLPLILIVIDELADLMATCPNEVEDAIARLTAMARAAGIHLIIATQRPSVDVITGVIKANIPSRVAFAVSSQVDSRTIIDGGGAEKLLGKGDMLYFPLGASKPIRTQGSFVTDKEVERITTFLKKQNTAGYDKDTSAAINTAASSTMSSDNENGDDAQEDDLLVNAVTIIVEAGYASISLLQRRMNVGYPRAARLIDRMQEKGYVGPFEGSKPRKVLISPQQWAEYKAKEGE